MLLPRKQPLCCRFSFVSLALLHKFDRWFSFLFKHGRSDVAPFPSLHMGSDGRLGLAATLSILALILAFRG